MFDATKGFNCKQAATCPGMEMGPWADALAFSGKCMCFTEQQHDRHPHMLLCSGLRRKGALVADGELQRIMANIDLDGNNTLDFQVGSLLTMLSECFVTIALHLTQPRL